MDTIYQGFAFNVLGKGTVTAYTMDRIIHFW